MLNVVLFEPEIPQNTGNIMRTCVATNTTLHLIKPLGFKVDDASLKRSGVNYIDKLKWYVYENWEDFLSKILKPHIDKCMRMPMTSNVRALNLSNTVAIMLYEALRQRNYNGLLFDEPHKSKTEIEDFEG